MRLILKSGFTFSSNSAAILLTMELALTLDTRAPNDHRLVRPSTFVVRTSRLLIVLASVGVITLGLLYYIGLLTSNFRTVRDNHLYRSAQMLPNDLENTFARYQIKTVLNLRGESRSGSWFKAEREVCATRNVDFESIDLDNDELPHPDEIRKLVLRLEQGPFPMLIHCRRGADRTGLASVLYAVIVGSQSLDDAIRSQLSWHQGHINFSPDANDRFLSHYRRTGTGQTLRHWIFATYPELYGQIGPNG